MKLRFLCLVIASTLFAAAPHANAVDEGLQLGAIKQIRVSGRVFDAATGSPVGGAQITVEGPSQNRRSDTGPDGTYLLSADQDQGFGLVSIVVSHADYQQKYVETLFRDAFPGRVQITFLGSRARVKAKNVDLELGCGDRQTLPTKNGSQATVTILCEDGKVGAEIALRGNRVAVLASQPFALRIDNGQLSVRDSENATVDIRVDAAMLPR